MAGIYLSLVIPIYNEGESLEKNLNKIENELKLLNKTSEIIFVEDKSVDNSAKKIEKFSQKNKNCKIIYHKKNLGRGRSVSDGIFAARGKICGYFDVDLEISEKYIPLFVNEIENGAEIVVGKRFYDVNSRSIIRAIFSKIYSIIIKLIINLSISDTECGYKFFNRELIIPVLKKTKDNHWFWDTEISARAQWAGLNCSELPVIFKKDFNKKSTVKVIPDTVDYILKLIKFRKEISKNG